MSQVGKTDQRKQQAAEGGRKLIAEMLSEGGQSGGLGYECTIPGAVVQVVAVITVLPKPYRMSRSANYLRHKMAAPADYADEESLICAVQFSVCGVIIADSADL